MKTSIVIKRLIEMLGKRMPLIILSLILAGLSVVMSLYINIEVGNAIDHMIGIGAVDFNAVLRCIIVMIICIFGSAIFSWLMNIILNKISYSLVMELRQSAFRKLQVSPASYIDSMQAGDLISRLVNDIEQISDGLVMGAAQLFTGVVTIAATLVFMFMLNPVIAPVVVVITPLTLLTARFIAKSTYKYFTIQSKENAELTSFTEETISGVTVVKSFSKEQESIDEFNMKADRLMNTSLRATFFSSTVNPTTRLINGIVYAGLGVMGAFNVAFGTFGGMTVGMLSSFLSYANQFTKPFNEISGVIAEFQGALASAARVFELLDVEEISEREDAEDKFEADGKIEIKNIDFSYVPDIELIKNFSIDVKKGQRIAIVGPTGCGKTTFINLLMRFYPVNAGDIFYNEEGISAYDITRDALRENYGMVLQETWLRSGTVRENIAMGKPDASDEEIIVAAKMAYCHGFISRLPDGYNTYIGDSGGMLSQGQKQLLCIARLMLAHPPMVILDEATSSIDTRTEIRIQKAFAKIMEGRTSFIVAHRLSTIKECDLIIVMKNGKIIERGNHHELLSHDGFYRELYLSQFD